MNRIPAIFGLETTKLTEKEIEFLKENKLLGIILFKRNIINKQQVSELIQEIKSILGEEAIISVDQEGGRVRRLRSEDCQDFSYFPPAHNFYEIYKKHGLEQAKKEAYDNYHKLASELKDIGFNMNYAPVCDLLFEETSEVIGDRSFGSEVGIVTELALSCIKAHLDAGVEPVIKHIPGHGRARLDSHYELPIVQTELSILESTDFKIFKNLAPYAKFAMTAHIVYDALDARSPATMSPSMIKYIRENIGFKNQLMTDDINMKALHVRLETMEDMSKALDYITQKSLRAGCDIILHCNGDLEEMKIVTKSIEQFFSSKLTLDLRQN